MAVIGYGRLAAPVTDEECEAAEQADILVEGFEEADVQFLDRIMKRAQGLPWTVIVTERCYLREITVEDLDDLFALYAQPGITDYTEPLYERSREEQYTRDYIDCMYRFYGYGMWLVFERGSGKLMGRAGFAHRDLGDEIVLEMGYLIGVPWQRQGYATEVCGKLLEFARKNLSDFGSLNCFVEPQNTASQGLMQKLGFAQCGTLELSGKEMLRYIKSLE
jgi:RimJ/RimL family protein N-acetyltransferase